MLCNLLLILKLVAHAISPPDVLILINTHNHLITMKARLQYILKCLNAFQLFLIGNTQKVHRCERCALGKERVSEETIERLSARLSEPEKTALLRESSESSDWIVDTVRKICLGGAASVDIWD